MKVAIIGASGFVGQRLINEALQRGYRVTAIARNPEKIKIENDRLTTKAADVNNFDELAEVLRGHDAVISAFNAGWGNPDFYNVYIKGCEAIQEASKKAGVKRLIVIGGAGSLEIAPGKQLVDSPDFPAEWKTGATAARDYLNTLRNEQDLDWTFLSPAIELHPGERTGKFRLGTDQPVFDANGKSSISAEDMSIAIIDELTNNQFIKKRFTVGY